MKNEIVQYHEMLHTEDRLVCERLHEVITKSLTNAENKIWHKHPVWFIDGNPIVGYHKLKDF